MSEAHGTHGEQTATASPFSEAEVQEFHKSDVQAGATFVILITSIFVIGLGLYSVVLGFVMAKPALS
jgi:hypothetical protein